MIYFLFQYQYGEVQGGFSDLVHTSTDINELLAYAGNCGEIWELDTTTVGNHPKMICNWNGMVSYNHEQGWYVPGTWNKFVVSEVN